MMINYDPHLGETSRSAGTGVSGLRIHSAWKQQEDFLPSEKVEQLGNKNRVVQSQTGFVPVDEGSYMM